jgi:hypothetical protein
MLRVPENCAVVKSLLHVSNFLSEKTTLGASTAMMTYIVKDYFLVTTICLMIHNGYWLVQAIKLRQKRIPAMIQILCWYIYDVRSKLLKTNQMGENDQEELKLS